MKKTVAIALILALAAAALGSETKKAPAANATPSKTAPAAKATPAAKAPAKKAAEPKPEPEGPPQIWFGFSANLDLVHVNLSTREYFVGFTPGMGFGVRWSPPWWTLSESFLALDALFGASFVNMDADTATLEYFQINATPVLSLGGIVSIGVGVSFNLALDQEAKDTLEYIFTFGLSMPVSAGYDEGDDE